MRAATVWLDNRAVEEARQIGDAFEAQEVYHATGQPEVAPIWPGCKLFWLRRNEPEIFARAGKFLLVKDFSLHRLTGQFVAKFGLQTLSSILDIQEKRWWEPMLGFVGVPPERLAQLMEPGAVVERLRKGPLRWGSPLGLWR